MSGFAAEWLALREPYDARARNPAIGDAATGWVIDLDPVTIVDLACGTGSTLRALSPHLPARQTWRLVDNDLSLLARAADSARPERAQVTALPVDLAHDLRPRSTAPSIWSPPRRCSTSCPSHGSTGW
jgi:trans-aconitate methyltransferase